MLVSALPENPIQRGMIQAVKKCKCSLVSTCSSGVTTCPKHRCSGPKTKPLEVPFVKKVMPRERFDKLTQYLHVNDILE